MVTRIEFEEDKEAVTDYFDRTKTVASGEEKK